MIDQGGRVGERLGEKKGVGLGKEDQSPVMIKKGCVWKQIGAELVNFELDQLVMIMFGYEREWTSVIKGTVFNGSQSSSLV